MTKKVTVKYFSDVLCVWAYVAQVRLDELKKKWQNQIEVEHHFVTLFANTKMRIGEGWQEKGGFDGFNKHVLEVLEEFPHCEINPQIWTQCRPSTSANAHIFLKAIDIYIKRNPEVDPANEIFELACWRVRKAFFQDALDISDMSILFGIADELQIDSKALNDIINHGEAVAEVLLDQQLTDKYKIEGSPSYLFNNGRQKLYGNVGFKIIDANIQEVLSDNTEHASWC